MMPSTGQTNDVKMASIRSGLAIQKMMTAKRGNIPANSAKRQPIVCRSFGRRAIGGPMVRPPGVLRHRPIRVTRVSPVVLVVAAEPRTTLVAAEWRPVEPLVHAPQRIGAPGVGRVRVVHGPLVEDERVKDRRPP